MARKATVQNSMLWFDEKIEIWKPNSMLIWQGNWNLKDKFFALIWRENWNLKENKDYLRKSSVKAKTRRRWYHSILFKNQTGLWNSVFLADLIIFNFLNSEKVKSNVCRFLYLRRNNSWYKRALLIQNRKKLNIAKHLFSKQMIEKCFLVWMK